MALDAPVPRALWRRLLELQRSEYTGRIILILDMKQGHAISGSIEAPLNVVIESPPK